MTVFQKHIDALFKKANQVTGVDTLFLFKGGFWLTCSQVALILIGLVFTFFITRLADKAFFGKYQLILSIIATLTIFNMPGINNALMRAVSLGKEKSLIIVFKERLFTALGGSLILLCISGYFLWFQNDAQLSLILAIIAVLFPTTQFAPLISSYFYAKKKFLKPSIISILERAVPVAAGLIALSTKDIFIFSVVYFSSMSLFNILVVSWFFLTEKLNNKSEKGLFAYGLKLTIANTIPKISQQIDKQATAFFLGLPQLAVYSVSLLIPDTIDSFSGLFQNLIVNKIVHTKPREIANKLSKLWIIICSVVGVIVISILIPFAIKIAFPQYAASIYLSQIYCIMLPAMFVWKTTNTWMITTKKLKAYTILMNSFYLANGLLIAGALFFWRSAMAVVVARVLIVYIFALIGFVFMRSSK